MRIMSGRNSVRVIVFLAILRLAPFSACPFCEQSD